VIRWTVTLQSVDGLEAKLERFQERPDHSIRSPIVASLRDIRAMNEVAQLGPNAIVSERVYRLERWDFQHRAGGGLSPTHGTALYVEDFDVALEARRRAFEETVRDAVHRVQLATPGERGPLAEDMYVALEAAIEKLRGGR